MHEKVVSLNSFFCSIVRTNVGMSPMLVLVTLLSSTGNLSPSLYICQEILAGGIPVAGQNSFMFLPGLTNKSCRPAPDTEVPVMLGSNTFVFILGGSEKG